MAWQNDALDQAIPYRGVDGKVLQASVEITSSANSTGVFVGKGLICIELIVSAFPQFPTGDDRVTFKIQSNTKSDTTTWLDINNHTIGDVAGIGVAITTGTYALYCNNQQDHQVRIRTELYSSTNSITYSAKAYPLRRRTLA